MIEDARHLRTIESDPDEMRNADSEGDERKTTIIITEFKSYAAAILSQYIGPIHKLVYHNSIPAVEEDPRTNPLKSWSVVLFGGLKSTMLQPFCNHALLRHYPPMNMSESGNW